jgi:hypothetical protein
MRGSTSSSSSSPVATTRPRIRFSGSAISSDGGASSRRPRREKRASMRTRCRPAEVLSGSGSSSSGSHSAVPGRIVIPGRAWMVTSTGSFSTARRTPIVRSTTVPIVPASTQPIAPSAARVSAMPGT